MRSIRCMFWCFLVALIFLTSPGCDGKDGGGSGTSSGKQGGQPPHTSTGTQTSSSETGTNPQTSTAGSCDLGMVIKQVDTVSLKPAGTSNFDAVLDPTPFENGDTVQVGDAALALAYCIGGGQLCHWSTGTYTSCCAVCPDPVPLDPQSAGYQPMMMMRRGSLPPDKQQALNLQEERIRGLGLDQTTTKLMLSDLYTNWKLTEAAGQLDSLSQDLEKPEARDKMKKLYVPVVLGAGRLYLKNGDDVKAKATFDHAVKVSSVLEAPGMQAERHIAIASFYAQKGANEKAVLNLQKAQEIYRSSGQNSKVTETGRHIAMLQGIHVAPQPVVITVPANVMWVDTGIAVQQGQHLRIQAAGSWSNAGPPAKDANGFANYAYPGTLLSTANLASLIGRAGDTMFAVGASFDGAAPASGKLYLSINDVPGTFADNQGALQVKIWP